MGRSSRTMDRNPHMTKSDSISRFSQLVVYTIALVIVLILLFFAVALAVVAIALHTADGIETFIEWAIDFRG